jgi:hypothetical protein
MDREKENRILARLKTDEELISALAFLSEKLDMGLVCEVALEAEKNNTPAFECLNTIRRLNEASGVSIDEIFALVEFLKQIEQKNSHSPHTTIH